MAKKRLKIKIDTINSLNKPEGTIKQLDSVFFNVEITEAGEKKDLTSQQVKLFAKKSDGKIVEQTTGISITDATNGQLTIDLLNAAVQVPGYVYFELEISDNGGTISTANFIYKVISKVGSDEAIESTNEVATLKKIEEYVAQAKVELQNFKKLQTSMLETNNSINNQEALRVEAESLRVTAEEGRVAAETKREEAFNKFEGRITANTEELEVARTATTGENFNSIDERIDCEVNRINKKIEISFLEQEDKESHVIENTIEGMTKDMIVKGKTLVNAIPNGFKSYKHLGTGFSFEGDTFVINGLSAGYQTLFFKDFIFKSNTKYTVIADIEEISLRNEDWRILSVGEGDGVDKQNAYPSSNPTAPGIFKETFTTPNVNIVDAQLFTRGSANGKKAKIKYMMVREGDWTNKEIPKYFEGIKSFGQEEGEINILSNGKNLCTNKTLNAFLDSNNIIQSDSTAISYIAKVPTKGTYYLNKIKGDRTQLGYFRDYPKIGDKAEIAGSGSVVAPNSGYIVAYVLSDKNTNSVSNVIVSEKRSDTFEEYKEYKKTILLSELGFDEGLRGLGSVDDELNSIKNKATKKIEKYIFTGNESISDVSHSFPSETSMMFGIKLNNAKLDNENVIVNNFKNSVVTSNRDSEGFYISELSGGVGVYFRILKEKIEPQGVEGFKNWLKSNQTAIYYELAEPVEIPLNKNINLKTSEEKTYISFETALSGTSSFKVPVNAAATISRLNRENKALEEENLKLKENMIETSKSLIEVDTNIIATNWDIDYRVCEIEWTLEDMGGSSPVNFKLLKKGVGNMALSRYEQAKIMILGGAYEKETLTRQLDAYLKRKYVSQEEYDELIALMEARDMVTNQ